MCPLRIILIFLSAALAGFFAWRSFRSAPHAIISVDPDEGGEVGEGSPSADHTTKSGPSRAVKFGIDGLRVFVDMASGRYLWKAMKHT